MFYNNLPAVADNVKNKKRLCCHDKSDIDKKWNITWSVFRCTS